jgi:hypothetical protein
MTRISLGQAVLVLLAVAVVGLPASLWAAKGKTAVIPVPAQADEEAGEEAAAPGFAGALEIRLQSEEDRLNPPAEMVLTGPGRQKTGYDPKTGTAYQEIPGSSYDWESSKGGGGPREVIIHVRNAPSGLYTLRLIATRTGKYRLYLRGLDEDSSAAEVRFRDAKILQGTVQQYLVNFSREGPRLGVRRTQTRE